MSPFAASATLFFMVFVANHIVLRGLGLWRQRPVFLAFQTVNVALALYAIVFGVPGFETTYSYSVMIGAMMGFRAFWNYHERRTILWEEAHEEKMIELQRALYTENAEE